MLKIIDDIVDRAGWISGPTYSFDSLEDLVKLNNAKIIHSDREENQKTAYIQVSYEEEK